MGRLYFAWNTVIEAASNSDDQDMKDALERAKKSEITKKNLISFVCFFIVQV